MEIPIAQFFRRTGMTQRELARICETDDGTISRIVNGKAVPTSRLAIRLAKATGLSCDVLLGVNRDIGENN